MMNKIIIPVIAGIIIFSMIGLSFQDSNASQARVVLSNICKITNAQFTFVEINVFTDPLPSGGTYPHAIVYCTDAEHSNKGSSQEKAEMISFDESIKYVSYEIGIFRGNHDSTACRGTIVPSEKITMETCTDFFGNEATMKMIIP